MTFTAQKLDLVSPGSSDFGKSLKVHETRLNLGYDGRLAVDHFVKAVVAFASNMCHDLGSSKNLSMIQDSRLRSSGAKEIRY